MATSSTSAVDVSITGTPDGNQTYSTWFVELGCTSLSETLFVLGCPFYAGTKKGPLQDAFLHPQKSLQDRMSWD
eukprot:15358266-Ditylum_brightwellii.AAC.1